MSYTILIVDAGGFNRPEIGNFVVSFQPDTDERGIGILTVTNNEDLAMQFNDGVAALHFYRQQSKVCPVRDDGKPNRPLTAFTASFAKKGTHVVSAI